MRLRECVGEDVAISGGLPFMRVLGFEDEMVEVRPLIGGSSIWVNEDNVLWFRVLPPSGS